MSDEESFVILGTSPTPSLTDSVFSTNNGDEVNGGLNCESPDNNSLTNSRLNNTMNTSLSSNSMTSNFSIIQKSTKLSKSENDASVPSIPNYLHHSQSLQLENGNATSTKVEENNSIESNESTTLNSNTVKRTSTSSLAADYILGEIEPDVLKESIYSQFPSICSNDSNPEDIVKLHCLMYEYVQLKETVRKTNATITKFFQADQKRQINMKRIEEDYQTKMTELEIMISKLRNENLELKSELENRMDQIALNDQLMRNENNELVMLVSEKSAVIENMRAQIEKMEAKDLSVFEYVKKSGDNDIKEHEYVPMYEYKSTISDLKAKMGALVAENEEIKCMQSSYIDEIDRLKKEVFNMEEMFKKEQANLSLLKRDNLDKECVFENYNKQIKDLTEEVNLLTVQVDLYRKDFKMEKAERKTLVAEKLQLLNDLKLLQRKNQQIIEEAQFRLEQESKLRQQQRQHSPSPSPSSSSSSSQRPVPPVFKANPVIRPEENDYDCPICNNTFRSINALQTHVQLCLTD